MRVKSLLLTVVYILIVFAVATIVTGCSTIKATVDACRDGLCR